eukprot:TRINITY_DN65520_c0_g1_i1.p1 TRINITY_DN65520_c0_g1~~TRINITY_DN65520_c0_g1_i1.p1  ORF type:complete len:321 (+),score=120.35 TRINITY_DN65520_c0_g1_i1:142-1104(+)
MSTAHPAPRGSPGLGAAAASSSSGSGNGTPAISVDVKVIFNGFSEVRERFAEVGEGGGDAGAAATPDTATPAHRIAADGCSATVLLDRRGGAKQLRSLVLNLADVRSVATEVRRLLGKCLSVKPICRGQNLSDHLVNNVIVEGEVIHCIVTISDDDGARQEAAPQPENRGMLRGFDRLMDAGITWEEIAHMRSQFLASRSPLFQQGQQAPDMMRLEDDWLDSFDSTLGGGGVPQQQPERQGRPHPQAVGDTNIVLEVDPPEFATIDAESVGCGYFSGFFFGFSSLLLLRSEWLLQTGVVLGLMVNFFLSFTAVLGDVPSL